MPWPPPTWARAVFTCVSVHRELAPGGPGSGVRPGRTPWPTAVAPRWRRRSQVISYVLRHALSGKRHASCGGYARAYGLGADWRPGRERRPSECVRRRRKRETRRDYSPHKMTAQRRRVTTSSPKLLVPQPGPCRALPPTPPGPSPPPWAHHGPLPAPVCTYVCICGGCLGGSVSCWS
jgi:hypothetical protein